MTREEAIQKFGTARESLKVGDHVLYSGCDSVNGGYVILAKVESIALPNITVREIWKYYSHGGEFPCQGTVTGPLEFFKSSLTEKIRKTQEFCDWLVKRWQEDEEKYGKV